MQNEETNRLMIDATVFMIGCTLESVSQSARHTTPIDILARRMFFDRIRLAAEKFKTSDIVLCWMSRKSHRKTLYPAYREILTHTRQITLDAYDYADKMKEDLALAGFSNQYEVNGLEGIDLIAHFVKKYSNKRNVMISNDSTLLGLLDQNAVLCYQNYLRPGSNRNPIREYDFRHQFEIDPPKWWLLHAICGDRINGIPGLKGVGFATAAKYLAGYRINEVKKAVIETGHETIELFHKLKVLPFMPIDLDLKPQNVYSSDGIVALLELYGLPLDPAIWEKLITGEWK